MTRVADYGGALYGHLDDEHPFADGDHRAYRPEGWVAEANAKYKAMSDIAEANKLSPIQFSLAWALSLDAVKHVTPTVIREKGETMKHVTKRIEEMATTPATTLTSQEMSIIQKIGDNTGCMPLKGASTRHQHGVRPDEWPLRPKLNQIAKEIGWNTSW